MNKVKKYNEFSIKESYESPEFDSIDEFLKLEKYLLEIADIKQKHLDKLYEVFDELGFDHQRAWQDMSKKFGSKFGNLFDNSMTEAWLDKYKKILKDTKKQVMFDEFSKQMDDGPEYIDEIDKHGDE